MQTVATPHPVHSGSFPTQTSSSKCSARAFPAGDLEAAREARKTKLGIWATLNLRQDFVDDAWMRDHIKAAGLRVPNQMEPATVTRLRSRLKRAKVIGVEIKDSLGTSLAGFLKLNDRLPLWAALALVLEATGRFIHMALMRAKEKFSKL